MPKEKRVESLIHKNEGVLAGDRVKIRFSAFELSGEAFSKPMIWTINLRTMMGTRRNWMGYDGLEKTKYVELQINHPTKN